MNTFKHKKLMHPPSPLPILNIFLHRWKLYLKQNNLTEIIGRIN